MLILVKHFCFMRLRFALRGFFFKRVLLCGFSLDFLGLFLCRLRKQYIICRHPTPATRPVSIRALQDFGLGSFQQNNLKRKTEISKH